jgi:hypothetical protein
MFLEFSKFGCKIKNLINFGQAVTLEGGVPEGRVSGFYSSFKERNRGA